ncbi:MAG TPA: AAA family ATPase [Terriglobia bacterium]|nr:AAA family ATPase [Terriglobia bacterium]
MTQRTIYEFDDFRVDTGQFLVMKDGATTPITPTVFRILLALLERAGETVTKEDLMKFVWPDSFVEEGNLNRNVSTLRKTLDEKPCDHKYIETIPKTGYRFIAPVRRVDYQPPAGTPRKTLNVNVCHVVGRESERKELRRAYDLAHEGHGGLICVSGDAGLGKTALVDLFVADLLQDGQAFHLARGRCSESLADGEPFIPWIEALGAFAHEPRVGEAMQSAAPTWYREISHTGPGEPRRMKRELLDFCKQISTVHPLVLVIDDFHWADVCSVDLLAYIAPRLESTRTLVVICYRPAEMKVTAHPFLQVRTDLLTRGVCTELQMRRLERADVEKHLALEYPEAQFPEDYAGFLQAKTEGNPLFLRELVRGTGQLTDATRDMIRLKINRLDDTHRQLLVTASVQGREFDSAVLAKSLNLSALDVEEALNSVAETHGIIERVREQQLPDGKFTVRYRFVYGFYQEACFESLEPTRKASINASLADAFLAYYGN